MTVPSSNEAEEDRKRGQRLYPRKCERNYWVLTELRRTLEKTIDRYITSNSGLMVDYGCGNMPYKQLYQKKGLHYAGYDFRGNDMAAGFLGDDGSLPLADGEADYVISSQVLEHVTDVEFYLKEALRVLKPEGKLILSTHGVWHYHPDPTDFWRWTGDGLVKVITEAGFEVEEFVGVVGPAATGIQIFQDAAARKVPRRLRNKFFWVCQAAMRLVDRHCPDDVKIKDASVFLCIAKSTK